MERQDLLRMQKKAQLELEGLKKLEEANNLSKGGAMMIDGDPEPSEPVGEGVVLMLSDESKKASLDILGKVVEEMESSEDEEVVKKAADLRSIAASIEKNAFTYESNTPGGDKAVEDHFKDDVVEIPDDEKNKPYAKKLETDDTKEVAELSKYSGPYGKM